MVAGPYPTKEMFEKLKGQATPQLEVAVMVAPSQSGWVSGVTELFVGFAERSILVAGFTLPGTWAADDFAIIDVRAVNADEFSLASADASSIQTRTSVFYGAGYTDVLLAAPMPVAGGRLYLAFNSPKTVKAGGAPVPPQAEAVGKLVGPADGNQKIPEIFFLEPMRDLLPTVSKPSKTGAIKVWRQEVVFPGAGAAPYLRLFFLWSEGSVSSEYHVPLTPGLPQ